MNKQWKTRMAQLELILTRRLPVERPRFGWLASYARFDRTGYPLLDRLGRITLLCCGRRGTPAANLPDLQELFQSDRRRR